MAILRPDEYKHSNQNYPIVDSNEVKGYRNVSTFTDLYTIPINKLREGTIVWVDDTKTYYSLKDINNYTNINGWNKINNIQFYDYFIELPAIGDVNTVYIVRENNKLYRWDSNVVNYVDIGGSNEIIIQFGTKNTLNNEGEFGQLSFDTSWLYICTQAGISGLAIWKKVPLINTI